MSTIGTLSRHLHLSEFSVPLQTSQGFLTPAQRRSIAQTNLGVAAGGLTGTTPVPIFKQVAPATATGSETLTAAKLLTGLINGTPAGAASYTLPLATDLETALVAIYPNLSADDAFEFSIQNLSTTDGQDITVLTNTGWTLSGRMIVEANNITTIGFATAVTFRVRRTAANAYTLYRVAG